MAESWAQDLCDTLSPIVQVAVDRAFVRLDREGNIASWLGGTLLLAGQAQGDRVGRVWAETFLPEDQAAALPATLLERALKTGRGLHDGWRQRPDGSRYWGSVSIYPFAEGGYGLLEHDDSERHERDMGIEAQREMLGAVIYSATDAVISTDAAGNITLFTPAAERVFGHSARAMLGRSLDTLMPLRFRGDHAAHMRDFADSRVSQRAMGAGRVTGLHADGHEIELEASISQGSVRGQTVLSAILRDVTARVRAEQAVARHRHELSDLTRRLMDQEKSMTRRLAQTLHDRLGQTLTAIRLSFDVIQRAHSQALSPAALQLSARVGQLIDEAIGEVRQVLVDLRPPLLDERGLAAALDNELRSSAKVPGTPTLVLEVDEETAAQRWPLEVEFAAFMIAREAVGNALNHARATQVTIALAAPSGGLQLEVVDDGVGLPGGELVNRPGHLGMVGMRERAAAIGASFGATTPAGGGTRVWLTWEPPA